MNDNNLNIDESKIPVAWRFNDPDCALSNEEKDGLIFLDETSSLTLWNKYIPVEHVMQISKDNFNLIKKLCLNFDKPRQLPIARNRNEHAFFFWGKKNACITDCDIVEKAWSDFFYPSDEDSILVLPCSNEIIFSFEDNFFFGHFKKQHAEVS